MCGGGGLCVCFGRITRVFSMREKITLKKKDHNSSKYGSLVNQVCKTKKLLTHLNILHNVYVMNQHFCIKVNVGFVETVSLEFHEPETLIYDFVFRSQECVVCGKALLGLRSRFGFHFIVFAA